MNVKYFPRIMDKILEERLEAVGAVLIAGPKWCGKTTTAEQQANYDQRTRLKEPDLLIIITGGEMAYTRKDGVKVIPIGTLKN